MDATLIEQLFSVQPSAFSVCLWWRSLSTLVHHRDTENAEVAQRGSD